MSENDHTVAHLLDHGQDLVRDLDGNAADLIPGRQGLVQGVLKGQDPLAPEVIQQITTPEEDPDHQMFGIEEKQGLGHIVGHIHDQDRVPEITPRKGRGRGREEGRGVAQGPVLGPAHVLGRFQYRDAEVLHPSLIREE